MIPAPEITAYVSTEAPAHLRWLAFYRGGKKLLPMFFTGPTKEAVISRADVWWSEQQEKLVRANLPRPPKKPKSAEVRP